MKRFEQKVRDIVEVRSFTTLHDYSSAAELTVEGYHFTDTTADLMSVWLDVIAGIKGGHGAALAMAGFRGVGKSHFLATFGALLSRPELRVKVSDNHVRACAENLSRRPYTVINVKRGSNVSLLAELKIAVAEIVAVAEHSLSDSLNDLFLLASEKGGDLPLIILIDTAAGRDSHVARDDGAVLGEIAETASNQNIFVGIALDDDIAGADGVNASITRTFAIHYLDQEHLYKIVETGIFPKHDGMRSVLHDVYEFYRESLPGFPWSEPRFTSLYPLHPAIMEIAPFIRLYLRDFALLGFAAEAGVRIMGRPANSLIALDEVFDNVEKELRKVGDLSEIFASFDTIERKIIAKIPVMNRLRAKLVLKGLLLASLDGGGASASDLCASLLILDDAGPDKTVKDIEEILKKCETEFPDMISVDKRENGETVFGFALKGKDDLNSTLTEAIREVSIDVTPVILRRLTTEKFSDLKSDDTNAFPADCSVLWRGSTRRGRIVWDASANGESRDKLQSSNALTDWTIVVNSGPTQIDGENAAFQIEWRLAKLRPDEIDVLRRYHVLLTNNDVRERFNDYLSASLQSHSIAVEKIWKRALFEEGVLVINGREYCFGDDALASHAISQLFTITLEPAFDAAYPHHPYFTRPLGNRETATLIGDFFGGGRPNSPDVQELAEVFLLPLGLVSCQGEVCVPESSAGLFELPVVRDSIKKDELNSNAIIQLAKISSRMGSTPYGFSREAQHLVITALVAQRQFEFVTAHGNRINWRSLDLQIIWDDIVGLAAPTAAAYSNERLLKWASAIIGKDFVGSLDKASDRSDLTRELSTWLAKWEQDRLLEQFESLPDANLNSQIWRKAANLKRSFGVVSESIAALTQNKTQIDQCLSSIADAFSDSDDEFVFRADDLSVVENFTKGAEKRNSIALYLATSEFTGHRDLEQMRENLLEMLDESQVSPSASSNLKIETLFDEYRRLYCDLYLTNHDAIMNTPEIRDLCDELKRSDDWLEFENLSQKPTFDGRHMAKARSIIREINQLECHVNTKEILNTQPRCICSFSFAGARHWQQFPDLLSKTMKAGLEAYRK